MTLSVEDRRSLVYFIEEKDDITRWVWYEAKRAEIEAEFPDLMFAIRMKQFAQLSIRTIVDNINAGLPPG